jgi:hypothetical protein
MSGKIERADSGGQNFTWELNGHPVNKRENTCNIHGVLFLDVDGTLTRPGSLYAIDEEAIENLTEFVERGGVCIFNTGATQGRLERTVFNPIFSGLDKKYNNTQTVAGIFRDRIIAMPENGSVTLLSAGVDIVENELYYLWHILHPLHVPDKENLRVIIENELVPLYKNSLVVGDHPGEMNPRQYILSWKGVSNTLDLVDMIQSQIVPKHPEIHWNKIVMKAARKTIDFIHADSGKQPSADWVLHEIGSFDGPILGFGDLGDEFGKVIPIINVNQGKPNEFRRRGVPAMELVRWELLSKDGFVVTGVGKNAKVRHSENDAEMNVLRDENGEIIYAFRNEKKHLEETINRNGYPVELKPVKFTDANGKIQIIQDAGKGTAWVLRCLMDKGYFSVK